MFYIIILIVKNYLGLFLAKFFDTFSYNFGYFLDISFHTSLKCVSIHFRNDCLNNLIIYILFNNLNVQLYKNKIIYEGSFTFSEFLTLFILWNILLFASLRGDSSNNYKYGSQFHI